jgi:hypothetical protein
MPTSHRLPATLACIIFFSALAATSFAQDDQPRPKPPGRSASTQALPQPLPPGGVGPNHLSPDEGPIVTVDFPGGSVSDYVTALRKAAGTQSANIVLSARAASVDLPPLSLRSVTLITALNAIRFVAPAPPGTTWTVQGIGHGVQNDGELANAPAFVVSVDAANMSPFPGGVMPPTNPGPDRTLHVFSMRDLTAVPGAAIAPRTVLTAIDAALQMEDDRGVEHANIQFHEDSGLLLVRGTKAQIQAVQDVVNELAGSVMRQRSDAERAQREQAERQTAVQKARIQLQRTTARRDHAARALDEAREAVAKGIMSHQELNAIQLSVQEAEADQATAEADLKAAEAGAAPPATQNLRHKLEAAQEDRARALEQFNQVQNLPASHRDHLAAQARLNAADSAYRAAMAGLAQAPGHEAGLDGPGSSDPQARVAALEEMISQAQKELQALRSATAAEPDQPAKPAPKRKP